MPDDLIDYADDLAALGPDEPDTFPITDPLPLLTPDWDDDDTMSF